LIDSIETAYMYIEGNKSKLQGVIFTNSHYATFVEFGTGLVGKQHPHPSQSWVYDVNNHGEQGWWYVHPESCAWVNTTGEPSKPFMHNTAQELEHVAKQLIRQVWR